MTMKMRSTRTAADPAAFYDRHGVLGAMVERAEGIRKELHLTGT